MATIVFEYDSIQTIAYTHTIEIDVDEWEEVTGEVFDPLNVDIETLQEHVGYGGIIENGGDVIDEQCENLRQVGAYV